jgi:hypothetical protein
METQELEKVEIINQKIQLVKGEFTPSEASDIINALIDEKINFHKLQRLQIWEGNHICKTDHLNDRITQLQKEKEITRDFISKARAQGSKLKINGILEISTID